MTDTTDCNLDQPAVGEILPAEDLDRVALAYVAQRGGLTYRDRRLDPTYNPFARPNPELPWRERWLPWRSSAAKAGQPIYTGPGCGDHEGHRNEFALTPPPETGPRRIAVERPERIA